MKITIRPLDYAVFFLSFGLFVIVGIFSLSKFQERGVLEVVDEHHQNYQYSLDVDQDIYVDGPLGTSHIRITDGEVSFVSSPCNDKICILAGKITRTSQWIACLPNKVFIQIKGEDTEVDRIST